MAKQDFSADIAVVGGGPAGLVAALALAAAGRETLLLAPPPPHADRRTTALLDGSVQILRKLGVWEALADRAAPLKFLRLVDATKRILRAPEALFDCAELGLEAFGYNVENEALHEVLLAQCREMPHLRIVEAPADRVAPDEDGVTLSIKGQDEKGKDEKRQDERVRLVAAADGRKSLCREAAGITMTARSLPQAALVLNFTHGAPHRDTSTEFHTESGPFTFAPLIGNRSSMVCVVTPDEADALRAMSDEELEREVERRAHSILGKMKADSPRGIFPLRTDIAERFGARRIALIGEAGHVLPPIGAQGLNLGIRDAATLDELVADATDDPGSSEVLAEYDRRRASDVRGRTRFVDFANRSLMSDFLPLHAARGLGLYLANRSGVVRRALMRQGLGPREDARDGAL